MWDLWESMGHVSYIDDIQSNAITKDVATPSPSSNVTYSSDFSPKGTHFCSSSTAMVNELKVAWPASFSSQDPHDAWYIFVNRSALLAVEEEDIACTNQIWRKTGTWQIKTFNERWSQSMLWYYNTTRTRVLVSGWVRCRSNRKIRLSGVSLSGVQSVRWVIRRKIITGQLEVSACHIHEVTMWLCRITYSKVVETCPMSIG